MRTATLATLSALLLSVSLGCGTKSDLTRRAKFNSERVEREGSGPPVDPPDSPIDPEPVLPVEPTEFEGSYTFDLLTGAPRWLVLEFCDGFTARLGFYDAGTTSELQGLVIEDNPERVQIEWDRPIDNGFVPGWSPWTIVLDGSTAILMDESGEQPWNQVSIGEPGCRQEDDFGGWDYVCGCSP